MLDVGQAFEVFKRIVANKPFPMTETESILSIIDPIFKNCLGWDEKDIARDERIETGILDYRFHLEDKTVLVLEVKRFGDYFSVPMTLNQRHYRINGLLSRDNTIKRAMEQAQRFSIDVGSRFAIVSNGHQFIIFQSFKFSADWHDSECIVFRSFADITSNFLEFFSLLSKQAVINGSLQTYFGQELMKSVELPKDLQPLIVSLENQAFVYLRSGKYEFAERLYSTMLDVVLDREKSENKRIHKGTYFHMIGFSLALQKKLHDSLERFLQAYIEDVLSTPLGLEDKADKAPAANVLMNGFHVSPESFRRIKDIAKQNKIKENIDARQKVMDALNVIDLFSLCNPKPEIKDVISILLVTLTPSAQKLLQENVSQRGEKILRVAGVIAKERGHPEVLEEDISDAIAQLEGKTQ